KNNGNDGNSDASVLDPINEEAVGEEDTGKGCACRLPGQPAKNDTWPLLLAMVLIGFVRRRQRRCVRCAAAAT
ncbi:MAG TPA: MYXO-CTERM sorting domain-containing protein, partial [Polyangiaceae bacterium]|nr:MYXO-CTERM sorting domain-containing protein [Polyangiaceae bacterium]